MAEFVRLGSKTGMKLTFLSLLSTTLQALISTLLSTLITNPTVNSYKRFDRDSIPAYATWVAKTNSAMVRILRTNQASTLRAELRIPDQLQIHLFG